MQSKTTVNDSYIDDYSFRSDGEDVLLLIVASVTPTTEPAKRCQKTMREDPSTRAKKTAA